MVDCCKMIKLLPLTPNNNKLILTYPCTMIECSGIGILICYVHFYTTHNYFMYLMQTCTISDNILSPKAKKKTKKKKNSNSTFVKISTSLEIKRFGVYSNQTKLL